MNLMNKIPREFYKLFASKYMDYYQQFLTAIYEESGRSFSLLGLTEGECRAVMNERIAETTLDWSEEQFDEEGELLTRSNMASICLKHLEDWGWLKRDYDEALNSYVVSFPEYSQQFVELFQRLYSDNRDKERESVLAVYSYLHTYSTDREKNNEILKSALSTSRGLLQMLANMPESLRGYFDALSRQKSFLGIQEVLVKEINNSDSKKYAILTTTDSFYRYKEAVKELVSQILRENDQKREQLVKERTGLVEGTVTSKRNQYRLEYCESASQLVYQVEREFDLIEKKYNKLIEQKTVFAKRALARIHYILQEGSSDEDHIVKLINLLDHHANSPQVLEQMRDRIRVGTQFKNITDRSFYNRKNAEDAGFHPIAMEKHNEETQMTDFVPKPLYTKKQLQEFRQKNIVDGRFVTDEQTIQSVEDLEKLLFLWQEETEDTRQEDMVHIEGELKGEQGFVFSRLMIDAKKGE